MKRNKKLYIILSLIIIVGLMIVGYAAYNQKLNISETSKIDSNFNILITNIEIKEVGGQAVNNNDPIYNGLEASFDITFNKKHDYIEYNVEVSNKGTIEAYLNQIKIDNEKSKVVSMSYRDINVGDKLGLGESKTFVVRVEYLGGISKGEIDLSLDYSAEENPSGEIILPEANYKVIYNTEENGGEKADIEEKNYNKGESIDLSNKGKKEGYTFVGWNTNKDSKEAIKELKMGEEDITLYAIYKKAIEVRYKIGDGISEIPKEKDTCEIYNKEEECTIELPSIENIKAKDGRVIDGWYKGTEKITNNTQKVRENSIYEIKAYTDTPAEVEINTSTLSNRIRVVTNITNNIEIEKYEYKIDNGEYIESNNTCSFENLEHNTEHVIKIRVTTIGHAVTEKEITVRTLEIATPTFTEETEGIVKISYPEECNGTYTCTYIKDGVEETPITKNPEEVIFGSSGTIIAKVTDGTNYITSSTYTVERTNLYVSNSGNDTNGYGTKEAPYLTLNKAYDCASLTQESTIYVMNDIAPTESTHLDENKDIVLTSYSENNETNTINKTSSYNDTKYESINDNYMIVLDSGNLTIQNINLNGNDIEFTGGAILNNSGTNVNLLNGTTISHFKSSDSNGPAVRAQDSLSSDNIATIIIDGANLSDNESINHGGGAIHVGIYNKLIMKSGIISNNSAKFAGGGIIAETGNVIIGGGTISNNSSPGNYGGGIFIRNSSLNMSGSTFITNNNSHQGGGICATDDSKVEMNGGSVNGNTVTGNGAGLKIISSQFNMNDGTISNNEITEDGAGHDGAGILLVSSSTGTITNGEIKSNTTLHAGGGISVQLSSELALSGGTISGNTGEGMNVFSNSKLTVKGGTIINNTSSYSSFMGNFNIASTDSTVIDTNSNYSATNNYYTMASALNNNFVIDVQNGTVANDTNVQIYSNSSEKKQKWQIYPYSVTNGVIDYILRSSLDGTQYLWVRGNSSVSGTNVITYTLHGATGGYWRLINQGNDYYQLKNIGGLCAYVASAANGTNVSANTCQNTNNFKWKFTPVS